MIQWFSKNNKTMVATIYNTNITINKPGLDRISNAYAAMVGYDEEKKQVVIKPLSKDDYDRNIYPRDSLFVLSGGKTYTRISSTDLVSSLAFNTGLSFAEAKKFECFYSDKENMLYVELNKEVN